MLNNIGPMGLVLIAVVVLVLFGRGKISSMMGEVGKGITSFKRGMDDGRREIEDAHAGAARDVTPGAATAATMGATATSAGVPPASVTPVSVTPASATPATPAAERRDAV